MSKQDRERYIREAHAMQSGVAMQISAHESPDTSPKHLRVGINSALVDSGALAQLLIDKGVISADEYEKAMADGMQREADAYRKRLSARHGVEVDLA